MPPLPAPPKPPRVPSSPSPGGGSGFGKKIGPLPVWAWAGFLIGMGALIYVLRKKGTTATSADNAAVRYLVQPGGGSGGITSAPLDQPTMGAAGVCPAGYHLERGLCLPDEAPGPIPLRHPAPGSPSEPPLMGGFTFEPHPTMSNTPLIPAPYFSQEGV